ncbi:MAG TPA: CRTAC1 family protein [Acidobacteriaceae bacterium]|nr:CRTAC1 family protein [Acidobacteriaceae bacterium]
MVIRIAAVLTVVVSLVVAALANGLGQSASGNDRLPADFEDVTAPLGVHFIHQAPHSSRKYLLETMGSGVALFDYDNDGRLDLYLVNGAPFDDFVPKGTIPEKTDPKYWNRLYHQRADGTFEDVTEKAGVAGVGYGMGVAAGDYNNDGNEDLFVTSLGENHLYRNNGNGTFTDVTAVAGVGGSGWSTSAAWVDLDGDGYLDLIVLRYIRWDWDDVWCGPKDNRGYCHPDAFPPISMLVYHNNGNGTFTEQAHKSGLDVPGKALGISIADYDRDGHPDIFVANDSMQEFLFHNTGAGKFDQVGLESGIAVDGDGRTFAGMGTDFADYDNDGWPDIFVDDLANQKYALFHNDRDSTFSYDSFVTGIGGLTLLHSGWGARFMDYDNDGWKDLLIAQAHDLDTIEKDFPQLHFREPPLLLRNVDGRKFVDVGPVSNIVFRERWVGRGLATGDIDNDGRIDAVITENGGPVHILMNRTKSTNHWIGFKLVGHRSNRDGIGAVIRIDTATGSQWVTVTTSSSYMSASDERAHFGLGRESTVQKVEIRWPSGIRQILTTVAGDRYIRVEEPAASAGK